ncbi:UDP-glucose 4-epimerase, partial [Vibrio parahaemolyticus]
MFVAQDQGNYYRIPSDNRDLNYSKYHEEGEKDLSLIEDYNSHNTERLDVDGMVKLLRKLDFIVDIEAGSLVVPEGV